MYNLSIFFIIFLFVCVLALVLYTVLWWYGCHVFQICRLKKMVFRVYPTATVFFGRMNSYPNILETGKLPMNQQLWGAQTQRDHWSSARNGTQIFQHRHVYVKQSVVYWHSLQTLQNKKRFIFHVTPLHRRDLHTWRRGSLELVKRAGWSKVAIPTAPCRCAQPRPKDSTPRACHWSSTRKQGCPGTTSLRPDFFGRQMGGGVSKWVGSGMVKHGLMYQIIIAKWRYIVDLRIFDKWKQNKQLTTEHILTWQFYMM